MRRRREKWNSPVQHSGKICQGFQLTFCAVAIENHFCTVCLHPGSQLSQSPSLPSSNPKKSRRYSHSRGRRGSLSSAPCPTSPHSPSLPLHLFPSSATHPSPVTRERLYPCTPGKKFVAVKDIEASRAGDLSLSKGMNVEGMVMRCHDTKNKES